MADTWDAARGVWVSGVNPNVTFNPDEGVWRNLAEGTYQDPFTMQWVAMPGGGGGTQAQAAGGTGFAPQAGFGYDLMDRAAAIDREMLSLGAQYDQELARVNADAQKHIAQMNANLQKELQAGNIDAQKFLQQKQLAQQEAEFARSLAQRQVEADRSWAIQQYQMSANPVDFVAYQFLKRGQAEGTAPAAGSAVGTGADQVRLPGAASDQSIQGMFSGLTGGSNTPWNPSLAGQGVFGVNIEAPNQLSRNEAMGLSDQEMGLLSSFLKAGVDVNGQRVALDPEDYFSQSERSWIPTLAQGARGGTQYRL